MFHPFNCLRTDFGGELLPIPERLDRSLSKDEPAMEIYTRVMVRVGAVSATWAREQLLDEPKGNIRNSIGILPD